MLAKITARSFVMVLLLFLPGLGEARGDERGRAEADGQRVGARLDVHPLLVQRIDGDPSVARPAERVDGVRVLGRGRVDVRVERGKASRQDREEDGLVRRDVPATVLLEEDLAVGEGRLAEQL